MKFQTQNSFTVIELLVAIAIIGLLASIVLVALDLPGKRRAAELVKSLQFSQSIQNVLGVGLVGWWAFENISGGITPDMSGYGNEGTLVNSPVQVEGVRVGDAGTGMALDCGGTNSYVDIGDVLDMGTSDFTISVWVRPSGIDNPASFVRKWDDTNGYILGQNRNWESWYWWLEFNGMVHYDNNITPKSTTDWNHLVFVVNRDGNAGLYVNGALSSDSVRDISDYGAVDISNDEILKIGGYGEWWTDSFIDEVRIYAQALSAAQIQKHYVEGLEKFKIAQK